MENENSCIQYLHRTWQLQRRNPSRNIRQKNQQRKQHKIPRHLPRPKCQLQSSHLRNEKQMQQKTQLHQSPKIKKMGRQDTNKISCLQCTNKINHRLCSSTIPKHLRPRKTRNRNNTISQHAPYTKKTTTNITQRNERTAKHRQTKHQTQKP